MNLADAFLITSTDNFQIEDDCACPSGAFHCSFNAPSASQFTTLPETYTTELPHHFHLALSPFAPLGPSVLNSAAWQRYQTFIAQSQPLTQPIDHQLVAENLIMPVDAKPQITVKPTETLTAWPHLTEQCNLRCTYCYAPQSTQKMDKTTAQHAIEQLIQLAKQRHCKRLKLKYAGGEPTLHFQLIPFIHDYAHHLATLHHLELEEIVLSNGVAINQTIADWLIQANVKLMLSIDGIGKFHDQQRPTHKGNHSFQAIQHVLTHLLLPRNIEPLINITITAHNAQGLASTIKWVLEHDLPFHLNFYRKNPFSSQHIDFEDEVIINGIRSAYQIIEQYLPTRPFLSGLLDKVHPHAHTQTCGAGHNYVVITTTGTLLPCQMLMNTTVKEISSPKCTNIACTECVLRYRCTGGCPLERYALHDSQAPHCYIYKTLYPEALRLEGLRLINQIKRAGHLDFFLGLCC